MKSPKKSRVFTTIVLFIIITALSAVLSLTAFNTAKENSVRHLQLMAEERSVMIKDYIANAEKLLSIYTDSSEIYNVIKKPGSDSATKNAQDFTDKVSLEISSIEGIYASQSTTKILVHSNKNYTGMYKRKSESLNSLYYSLQNADSKVYNSGIVKSDETGNQIIQLFKAVMDDRGATIGITGLDIDTRELSDSLNNLTMSGMESAVYNLVNAKDNCYIFADDSSMTYKPVERQIIKDICYKNKTMNKDNADTFEFEDNGVKYLSAYVYMADNNWLLMVDIPKKDVNEFATVMTMYIIVFWLFTLLILILFNNISRKQEETNEKLSSSIQKNEMTKRNLNKAVMEDILTDTFTRNKFISDYTNPEPSKDNPYYFVMINIPHFSDINIRYGNDVGDQILVQAANALKKEFGDENTYRTGSDEFVAVIKSNSTENVNASANKVIIDLCKTVEINGKNIPVNCIAAVVKKSRNINPSVLLQLKNMLKSSNGAPLTYMDADMM